MITTTASSRDQNYQDFLLAGLREEVMALFPSYPDADPTWVVRILKEDEKENSNTKGKENDDKPRKVIFYHFSPEDNEFHQIDFRTWAAIRVVGTWSCRSYGSVQCDEHEMLHEFEVWKKEDVEDNVVFDARTENVA